MIMNQLDFMLVKVKTTQAVAEIKYCSFKNVREAPFPSCGRRGKKLNGPEVMRISGEQSHLNQLINVHIISERL